MREFGNEEKRLTTMTSIIETLFKSQNLLRKSSPATAEQREAATKQLRDTVPPPVLAHYLRMVANDRNGVALVRRGICCECHIRIPVSTIGSLLKPVDVHLCENCGCYLLLPPGEDASVAFPPETSLKRKAPRRPARRAPEEAVSL